MSLSFLLDTQDVVRTVGTPVNTVTTPIPMYRTMGNPVNTVTTPTPVYQTVRNPVRTVTTPIPVYEPEGQEVDLADEETEMYGTDIDPDIPPPSGELAPAKLTIKKADLGGKKSEPLEEKPDSKEEPVFNLAADPDIPITTTITEENKMTVAEFNPNPSPPTDEIFEVTQEGAFYDTAVYELPEQQDPVEPENKTSTYLLLFLLGGFFVYVAINSKR